MLVLFDIDGTLILSGRAGIRGMNRSFERLFNVPGALDQVTLAGRTDRAIVMEALTRAGQMVDDDAIVRVRDAYLEDLREAIADKTVPSAGVLPGVIDLLDELARENICVGLLTGNFEDAAAIKLGHYGLWNRFSFGAFGDLHADRRSLVPVAVAAAAAAGHGAFEPERVIVIGDTPLDVDCAHAYGARAVAVATGPFSHEALAEHRPAITVHSLTELDVRAIASL
jgi:phosphoglycolate phosphatase-like HAD superfamily hydrolase